MTDAATVGINLSGISSYSTEYPFIDRFKTSTLWTARDANWTPIGRPTVDANGYPTAMPAGAASLYAMVELDPAKLAMTDVYVLTYTGDATISISQSAIISQKPGEIVFRYGGDGNQAQVNITAINAANPVSAIHVVRQDQVALFNAGEIFNPDFIDKISPFSTLRYMEWSATNDSKVTSWNQRTTLSSASWSANSTGGAGVPIEVMVALANKTHTNMWLNIPAQADDDYVKKTLAYVHDHLESGLNVQVEYSNEVWNWQFGQAQYALAMGDKLFGKDVNGDGKIDSSNSAEHVGDGYAQFYGYRSAQIAVIAKSIFANDPSREQSVLSTQTGWQGLEASILAGAQRVGNVPTLFDNYAITTYFDLGKTTQATLVQWAQSGSAGLDAAFAALSKSLDWTKASDVYQEAVAAKYGLNLVAYEGGISMTTSQYSTAAQPIIQAFFDQINTDPRMTDLYLRMVADFSAAGGTALNAFNDAGTPSQWGEWGALTSIYDTTSPKYSALVAAAKAGKATAASSLGNALSADGLSIATTASIYTLTGTVRNLAYAGTARFAGIGNDLDNVIVGGDGANTLSGGAGQDRLIGGSAADYLDGGTGADTMIGGGGNDVYIVDDAGDVVIEAANGGTDEVRSSLALYSLADNVENLTFTGTSYFTGTGNGLDNILVGGNFGNVLSGGDGKDTLIGGTGNDFLDGGTGADKMSGGAGNDTYVVDNVGDQITELSGGGIDEVDTSLASYTLGANLENLKYTGSANFTGAGNSLDNVISGGSGKDYISGGAGSDTLYGNDGNDTLDGGAGADTMYGGLGDDTYYVDNVNEKIVELAGQGTDTVRTTVSYTMSDNLENLYLDGNAAINATGNATWNYIVGNAADNVIDGGGGNDTLTGGDGNDTLIGGAGNDLLQGGNGNDILYGGTGDDQLNGDAGNDILYGGGGKDSLDGGLGGDTYRFLDGDLGKTTATSATVLFSHAQGDKIDLSLMDAISKTSGKDSFKFIGTGAFTKHAGELREQSIGGYWIVSGDLDGDGVADVVLTINSSTQLVANDFIL